MPNGRFDYDLDGAGPVLSTIETWRQPEQQARPWTPAVLEPYRELAPRLHGPLGRLLAPEHAGPRTTPRSTTTGAR